MSRTVSLPELTIWLLRIGSNAEYGQTLLSDQILFSAYYAALADLAFNWPEDVAEEISKAAEVDTDNMLRLMSALRNRTSLPVSGGYSARFKESEPVYRHYRRRPEDFCAVVGEKLETIQHAVNEGILPSTARPALTLLGKLAGFKPLESELVTVALGLCADRAFSIFLSLAMEDLVQARQVLPLMLDCTADDLAQALTKDSALIRSGLMLPAGRGQVMQPLSQFWMEQLFSGTNSEKALVDALLEPFHARESSGAVGRLHPDDDNVLRALLAGAPPKTGSMNVLIYGPGSINKRAIIEKLLLESNLPAWTLKSRDVLDQDLPSLCFFAQRALAATHPNDVLVVDKAASVLTGRKVVSFLFFMLAADEDEEIASVDQTLLEHNPLRTIWISTSASRLSEESLGRFLFHAELKRGSRAERRQKVQEIIASLGLSDKLQQALTLQGGLSEQQLHNAVALANLTAKGDAALTEAHILHAVQRSQSALARREKEDLRVPVTQYSYDFLNTSGKFGPVQILNALRKRPSASLAIYGIPGTGKSAFAEHIAAELDRPLIARTASELLDKYLGESEKRLAEMFAEAESEEAVLLLDEADSFLRDRSMAEKQWEVSQVNELLKRMESFQGIFICATNLFDDLDTAAMRRFTFKMEFLKLTDEQAWKMYLNESGLGKQMDAVSEDEREALRERLATIEWLTPGDFATVKRQCILLGEELNFTEWLDQLKIEADLKKKAFKKRGIGFAG